jgi:hypothetical protein
MHLSARSMKLGIAMLIVAGCSHSVPTGNGGAPDQSDFTNLVPRRLTYSSGADIQPRWTADGTALMYTFEAQLPDQQYTDRCLGALPPDGGSRVGEWCWSSWDQETRRDGVAWGTMSTQGDVVFNHHHGTGDKQIAPFTGGFYHVKAGAHSTADATELLGLIEIPTGGVERYDYLLSPVYTGDESITALAGQILLSVSGCPINCKWDTVYTGLDLVRLSTRAASQPQVLARLLGASNLSWDPSVDRFFFGRADRVEAIPTSGGRVTVVWQLPRSPDRGIPLLTGVSAGGGRVAVSWQYSVAESIHSVMGVLDADGGVQELVHSVNGPFWGALALSPDGTRLVAERRDITQRDLYLWFLGP